MYKDAYHPRVKQDVKKLHAHLREIIKTEHLPEILAHPEGGEMLVGVLLYFWLLTTWNESELLDTVGRVISHRDAGTQRKEEHVYFLFLCVFASLREEAAVEENQGYGCKRDHCRPP